MLSYRTAEGWSFGLVSTLGMWSGEAGRIYGDGVNIAARVEGVGRRWRHLHLGYCL